MLSTYFIYRDSNNDELSKLSKYIIIAASVKFLILFISFIIGEGELVGNMVKVTKESGKTLIPFYATVYFLSFYKI